MDGFCVDDASIILGETYHYANFSDSYERYSHDSGNIELDHGCSFSSSSLHLQGIQQSYDMLSDLHGFCPMPNPVDRPLDLDFSQHQHQELTTAPTAGDFARDIGVSRAKRTKRDQKVEIGRSCISFGPGGGKHETDAEAMAHVKELIYRAAAMRPVHLGMDKSPERPRRRRNVRISSEPQTMAARQRRERISERLRALQRLVPGGSKMDTATMLDEAACYLRFLQSQVRALETLGQTMHCNVRVNSAMTLNHYSQNPSFF